VIDIILWSIALVLWTAVVYHVAWRVGWNDHMRITDEADSRYFRKRGWIE
jgi:hypothetical protein